jgi:hypothetical protein
MLYLEHCFPQAEPKPETKPETETKPNLNFESESEITDVFDDDELQTVVKKRDRLSLSYDRKQLIKSPLRKFINANSIRLCGRSRLKKLNHLVDWNCHNSFNLCSPLMEFTKTNTMQIISIATMKMYKIHMRLPRIHGNINQIQSELRYAIDELNQRQRIKDYFKMWCLDKIRNMSNMSNMSNMKTIRFHKDCAMRELIACYQNNIDRKLFIAQNNISNVTLLPCKGDTIFTVTFPDDKVHCYRYLADSGISGFEAHIEYLSKDKIRNYCTAHIDNMSVNEVIDFVRNFSSELPTSVQTDKHKIQIHQSQQQPQQIATIDFYSSTLINQLSETVTSLYKNASVSYLDKWQGSKIRVTLELSYAINAIDAINNVVALVAKKYKNITYTRSSLMIRWIAIH